MKCHPLFIGRIRAQEVDEEWREDRSGWPGLAFVLLGVPPLAALTRRMDGYRKKYLPLNEPDPETRA